VLATLVLLVLPAVASAQASITGVVRDSSGGVLPGVTVEAASPALIERARAVITDASGQYRIVDLRPGLYTVTFTLTGFSTVRREQIALTGAFTATVNAQLAVGALEETITVTGEAPTVDVQSTTRQRVIDRDVLDAIPSSRTEYTLGVLVPGVTATGGQDVGGSGGQTAFPALEIHGSRSNDLVQTVMGMSVAVLTTGSHQPVRANPAATQEIAMDMSGSDAEYAVGGVRIHRIPREGGNRFNATFFGSFANDAMQGSNVSQKLADLGLRNPDSISKTWDVNPGFGGPLKRDKVWFYLAARHTGSSMYAADLFWNRNLNNPNVWTFEPDLSRRAVNERRQQDGHGRISWQATAQNKIGLTWHEAVLCWCPQSASVTSALEAEQEREYPIRRIATLDWTNPITNRFLLEAGGGWIHSGARNGPRPSLSPDMIQVMEQSTGMTYRAGNVYHDRNDTVYSFRFAASYITGAHALKAGIANRSGNHYDYQFVYQPVAYRLNNGVPNQITQYGYPFLLLSDVDTDLGLFVQDRWTIRQLTLNMGLRYDHYANSFPDQHMGPTRLTPTRDITFPAQDGSSYHDLTPRLGASYNLFGDARTAIKVSLNRYLSAIGSRGLPGTLSVNPAENLVLSTTRAWTDANRNYVPECDLTNGAANGECGPLANALFGQVRRGANVDPDLIRGWGKREYNWEFSAGVQHEIVPRVAADVAYFRRSYGNVQVTQNRAVTAADFDPFSIVAPQDPRLPGGGGYVISGLYDVKPAKFGQVDQLITRAENVGTLVDYWHGFDVTLNARPRPGLLLQGGTSTGRRVTDDCDIRPRLDNPSLLYCHVANAFLTQVKFIGSYTIPRVDLQVSAAFQSLPGPQLIANFDAPTTDVRPSLGRDLAGGTRNVRVNLVEPGTMYGERMQQLDIRFAKILRVAGTRTTLGVDLYNALNSSAVLRENAAFGRWRQPIEILLARFVKFNVQFDY
jgi:hypothetical protein